MFVGSFPAESRPKFLFQWKVGYSSVLLGFALASPWLCAGITCLCWRQGDCDYVRRHFHNIVKAVVQLAWAKRKSSRWREEQVVEWVFTSNGWMLQRTLLMQLFLSFAFTNSAVGVDVISVGCSMLIRHKDVSCAITGNFDQMCHFSGLSLWNSAVKFRIAWEKLCNFFLAGISDTVYSTSVLSAFWCSLVWPVLQK